jgi:ABC-2 type transport system permease protein
MGLRSRFDYLLALARMNIGAGMTPPGVALLSALFMFGNNLIFFVIWRIYFGNFSNLRGWRLQDLALLIGMCAWAFGLTVVLAGGVRTMSQAIADGGLDVHLGRPRHPLPSLLMSRSLPSGLGDLASAFVFWLVFGGRGLGDLPLLLLVATAAGIVLAATAVLMQCLAFWLPDAAGFCEELFNLFLMVAFYPQHPFSFTVRVVLFTLVPAAFVSFLPVETIRDADPLKALAMIGAAGVYATIATAVFQRGLRRYSSGNRMLLFR